MYLACIFFEIQNMQSADWDPYNYLIVWGGGAGMPVWLRGEDRGAHWGHRLHTVRGPDPQLQVRSHLDGNKYIVLDWINNLLSSLSRKLLSEEF